MFLTGVCPNVSTEPRHFNQSQDRPCMYRSANAEEGAKLDVKAQNFWDSSRSSAFFYIKVFNSYLCMPPSNCKKTSAACYRRHQQEKRHIYNIMYKKRINNVEHVSFTPIVLSSTGGLGPTTMAFNPVSFLRSLLTSPTAGPWHPFNAKSPSPCMLDSTIMCLKGARFSFHRSAHDTPVYKISCTRWTSVGL